MTNKEEGNSTNKQGTDQAIKEGDLTDKSGVGTNVAEQGEPSTEQKRKKETAVDPTTFILKSQTSQLKAGPTQLDEVNASKAWIGPKEKVTTLHYPSPNDPNDQNGEITTMQTERNSGFKKSGLEPSTQGGNWRDRLIDEPRKLEQAVEEHEAEYLVEFPPDDSDKDCYTTHKMQEEEEEWILITMGEKVLQLKRPRLMNMEEGEEVNEVEPKKLKKDSTLQEGTTENNSSIQPMCCEYVAEEAGLTMPPSTP